MEAIRIIYRKIFVSVVCLIIVASPSMCQDASTVSKKTLSKKEIKDLTDLARYDKTVKKLRSKKRKKKRNDDSSKKVKEEDEIVQQESNFSFGLGPIFSGFLYVLIAALVIFILFTIFSSIKVDKKIKNPDIPKQDEIEDIEIIDAESGLELALKAGNYRDAVRMLFIKLLQVLVQQNSIKWKSEKTNRDYLKEMFNHQKIQHFNNLVIAYERIWYGSEPIDKLFFEYLRADFEKFYSTENVNLDVEE